VSVENEIGWVVSARSGNRQAYERLANLYYQPLVQRVRRLLGDYHLAQDVAQEALLRAHTGLHSLDDPGHFGRWLFRIGRNIAVDRVRRLKRSQELELLEPQDLDRHPSVREPPAAEKHVLPRSLAARQLWSAVTSLPARDQRILLLRFGRGLSQRQVAEECGLSLAVVKVALYRGRARLARLLQAAGKIGV